MCLVSLRGGVKSSISSELEQCAPMRQSKNVILGLLRRPVSRASRNDIGLVDLFNWVLINYYVI